MRVGIGMGLARPQGNVAAVIRALFLAGEQGAWYDPSDFSTMYQDHQGQTPVTAVEQPVGRLLDKRLGAAREPELWYHQKVSAVGEAQILGSQSYRIYSSAGAVSYVEISAGAYPEASVNTASDYEVTFNIDAVATGSGAVTVGNIGPAFNTVGYKRCFTKWNGSTILFKRQSTTGLTDITISNISVREVKGNHATQATAASRPVLSARVNALLATSVMATQSVTTTAIPYTLSFKGTGSVTLSGTSTAGPLAGTGADNRVSLTFTPTAGTLTLTVTGSVTDAQLETGPTATRYQRVTTATDYDTAGFPHYLKFDGVDDFLSVPLNLSGTNKLTVWAAARVNAATARTTLIEHSSTYANPGTFGFDFPTSLLTSASVAVNGSGTFATRNFTTTLEMSRNYVLTMKADIGAAAGSEVEARTDGVSQGFSTGDAGTGNFIDSTFYIGARGGSANRLNGHFYGLIVRGAASNDADIGRGERLLAGKSGVSL